MFEPAAFDEVVLKGVLTGRGMVSLAKVLTPGDTAAVRVLIIGRANQLKAAGPGPAPKPASQQPHQQQ